jgi:hypothetical protein
MRALAAAAGALAVFALAAVAAAPRTIVVRGHVTAPDGRPVAGARIMARGTIRVSALTDGNGRYTLSVPLGMPAALRRAPFRLEVRAEAAGRRLPLVGGGASLELDATWQPATGRVRVQSNRQAAATAVATAIEVDDVPIAWIDADFGGDAKEAGAGSFAQEAALPGGTPAPARVAAPVPRNSVSTVEPAPARSAAPVPRNSVSTVEPAPARVAAPAPHNSVSTVEPAPARSAAPAPRNKVPAPVSAAAPAPPKIVASARTVPAAPPRTTQVRSMEPYAPRDSAGAPDTCRCSVRGTVEIDWPRPLEDHTLVKVELDSPGAPSAEVSLFMGAPREFRFGPLPCGDWRLRVRAGGKIRYAEAGGDTVRIIHCAGAAETRVVLVPVRR